MLLRSVRGLARLCRFGIRTMLNLKFRKHISSGQRRYCSGFLDDRVTILESLKCLGLGIRGVDSLRAKRKRGEQNSDRALVMFLIPNQCGRGTI